MVLYTVAAVFTELFEVDNDDKDTPYQKGEKT